MTYVRTVKRPGPHASTTVCRPSRLRQGSARARGLFTAATLVAGTGAAACDETETLSNQRPELTVDRERIDFGPVPIGATRRVALEVVNTGRQVLEIREVVVPSPFSVDVSAMEVAPGSTATLDLAYSPELAEEASSELVITSNGSPEPIAVALSGTGVQAVLRGFPAAIDFGARRLQESTAKEIVLATNTVAPVEGRIVTESFDRPAHWELTFVPEFGESSTFALPGLSEQISTLTYRPLAVGLDHGRVLFEFCGERCGVFVDVRAEAVESGMRIEPGVLDFGSVGISEAATRQLVVSNVGDEAFTIDAVRIEGTQELSFESDTTLPATIQPDGFLTVRVTYQPFAARETSARLLIETDEPEIGTRDVPIFGEGAGPRFEVVPALLQFGVVDDRTTQRPLLMANSGSSSLQVTQLDLSGDPQFRIVRTPPIPIRIGPGETVQVDVELEPDRVGTFTATVTVASNRGAQPEVRVPVRAFRGQRFCRLTAVPDRLNFGVVSPGLARTATVTFRNDGNEDCAVEGVGLRNPSDPFFSLDFRTLPDALAPGEMLDVPVRFAPTEDRDGKAALVVQTNDPLAPRATVNLVGTALTYTDVFVQPPSIDLGALRPDCNRGEREVELFNVGDRSVEVETVSSVPLADEFGIAGPEPVEVDGGETASWMVGWEPSVPGELATDVVIDFADLPFPLRVPVTGRSSFDARAVDEFEQRDVAEVDVLFVIDDSCSMQDDQQALAANADTFIREADLQDVRYRIGITTTSDWPDQGRLVGPVIDRDDLSRDEIIAEFGRQARVGISGSGIEEGAASAVAALRKARRGNQPNADLLRPGASLVLIIVTDEDDSSPAFMASYYRDLRRLAPQELVVAVVSGGPMGCGTAIPTPRYQSLLDLTDGQHVSICADWGRNLEQLGRAAFAPRDRFTLRSEPEPTLPIEVWIDGRTLASDRWSRAAGSATIVFSKAPPPRSEIRVSYVPRCR